MQSSTNGEQPPMADSFVPQTRSDGLLERAMDDEMVLYDVDEDRVHALNPAALGLWRACDGTADVAALATRLETDRDVVWYGLSELDRRGLLTTPLPAGINGGRVGRREMLRKIAIGGTIGLAVPTIMSVVAADPAAAVTCRGLGETCSLVNKCTDPSLGAGNCCGGKRCCGQGNGNPVCQSFS